MWQQTHTDGHDNHFSLIIRTHAGALHVPQLHVCGDSEDLSSFLSLNIIMAIIIVCEIDLRIMINIMISNLNWLKV